MKKKGLAGSFAVVVLFIVVIIAVFSTDSERDDNYEKTVGETSSYEQVNTGYAAYTENSSTNDIIETSSEVVFKNQYIPEYSGERVEIINRQRI